MRLYSIEPSSLPALLLGLLIECAKLINVLWSPIFNMCGLQLSFRELCSKELNSSPKILFDVGSEYLGVSFQAQKRQYLTLLRTLLSILPEVFGDKSSGTNEAIPRYCILSKISMY